MLRSFIVVELIKRYLVGKDMEKVIVFPRVKPVLRIAYENQDNKNHKILNFLPL